MPVYQIVKFLRTPGRLRKVKKARAAAFAVAAIALVAGILLIPTPLRIQGTLVLTAAKPDEIYAEVEGQLVELNVRDGEWVTKDTVLAKLIQPREAEGTRAETGGPRHQLRQGPVVQPEPGARASRPGSSASPELAEELEPIIEKINDQIGKLTLVATRDGQVIGVPHPETVGQWLKPGKPFCEVGDPHHLEAHLIVDQADIDLIRLDRRAWVKIYGQSETTYLSEVSEIAKRSRDEIPPELSNMADGEIASKPDPKTGAAKPQTAVYEVIIPIENPSLTLQPGLRGFAKIDGGTNTLGWWLWRLYFKTFNFRL